MKQEVSVSSLMLDSKNPRMEIQAGHRDAIRALFNDNPKQMINLLEDIAENGLSPLENIGVSPEKGGRFVVKEGNRRVAALCALYSPELIRDSVSEGQYKEVRNLSKKFLQRDNTDVVECEVLSDEEWDHWITLRHTGSNEGRGLVSWGPMEKSRYLHRSGAGTKPIELQLIDWYSQCTASDKSEQQLIGRVPVSSLKRLLDDTGVRTRLGITVQHGLAMSAFPPDEMFKWVRRVIHDLAKKEIKVADIYDAMKMREYLDKFSTHELPDPAKELKAAIPIEPLSTPTSSSAAQKKQKVLKHWTIRELKIAPKHSRIRDIWMEIRQLGIEKYPNVHSVVLRVFTEMTVEDYLNRHNIPIPNDPTIQPTRPTLGSKVAAAADHLESQNIMKKAELVPARKLSGKKHPLYSTQSLHQYVHNQHVHPSSNEIVNIWKDIGPFLAKLHER